MLCRYLSAGRGIKGTVEYRGVPPLIRRYLPVLRAEPRINRNHASRGGPGSWSTVVTAARDKKKQNQ